MSVVIWLLLPLGDPLSGQARDDAEATAQDLRHFLEQYDQAGGGNTVPIEKAILKLRDLRAGDKLAGFLKHDRFGTTVAWAVSEINDQKDEAVILKTFASKPPLQQVEVSRYVAGFRTRTALAWIRERAGDPPNPAFIPALVRAGDPAILANLRRDLKSGGMSDVTFALRLVGEGRNPDLLGDLVGLVDDARPLSAPLRSKLVRGGGGPELKTIGDLALEAASEVVAPNTPGYIAWWHELEETPRFAPGKEGREIFTEYLEATKNARAAGAVDAEVVVKAVLTQVRSRLARRSLVRISSFRFDESWSISYVVDEKKSTVTVSKEGKVVP